MTQIFVTNCLIKAIRWPLGCLIAFICGCNQQQPYKKLELTKQDKISREALINRAIHDVQLATEKIRSGDLITRTGNDFTSESLRLLNRRNTTYSHCGIASIEHDSIFIYHALGGEWNPNQKIRRDLITDFSDPYNNKGIGIFRFEVADTISQRLINTVQDLYKKGLMFDMKFDLESDDRMYCAEFVYKSLLIATDHSMVFNISHIDQFKFIGVDDLFLQPGCILKQQIVYK